MRHTTDLTRRGLLMAAACGSAAAFFRTAGLAAAADLPPVSQASPADAARDAEYWARVSTAFDVDRSVINLENAYWGVLPRSVQAAYHERLAYVNRHHVAYVRNWIDGHEYAEAVEAVRGQVAGMLGCARDEIALARSGTEALQNLIVNYRKLAPGDAVIYADLDYPDMQMAMDSLVERRGVNVVRFAIPEPATRANVLEAYDRILSGTPRAKLLLVTHLSNRTGLVPPVAEIAAMARARGVEVILDAAQTVGQIDFQLGDLGVDFAGFSLHKWVGAPLGTAGLYIKADRLSDVTPHMGNTPEHDVRSRVFPGTTNFAATLTVPDALAFQDALGGVARKQVRLQYLRDYWVNRVRSARVQVLTPDDPALYGSVTSFRIAGLSADAVQEALLDTHRILTVARTGIAGGDAVRVTPALYNTERDLDRLVEAIQAMAAG